MGESNVQASEIVKDEDWDFDKKSERFLDVQACIIALYMSILLIQLMEHDETLRLSLWVYL